MRGRRRYRRSTLEQDIKAPDGFLLGGMRRVRSDGTILFQRGWYKAPAEWVGETVWVHCTDGGIGDLEAAPPGMHIYNAQSDNKTVLCERTKRADAQPGYRNPAHKAWSERMSGTQP